MEKRGIRVKSADNGKRLDIFLSEQFSDYSRSFIQTQIKNGSITLNDKISGPGVKIKTGEKIQISFKRSEEISIMPERNILLDIIFEDNNLIVINKHSGIVVHPSESTPAHTIVNALLAHYPDIATVGDDPKRPGIVHRLDKDVSGLMVVAKNQKAFDFLKQQFKNRTVIKKYTALVYGNINPADGSISAPIGRSTSQPSRMSVKKTGEGREALTFYKTIKKYNKFSLLDIEIKTGRTHQIRVHLLSRGNPVVGDQTYYLKKSVITDGPGRIFLHAHHIQFMGLDGDILQFNVDIPEVLKQFIKQLT